MVSEDWLTVVSNLAFLFPMAEAFERQYIFEGMIYLSVVICSSLYHLCNSWAWACLGLPPNVLRDMDFLTAQYCIPLIALYCIKPWSKHWYAFKTGALLSIFFALFLAQRYLGNSPYVQMIVAAISFGAIFLYWLVYALRRVRKHQKNPGGPALTRYLPRYRWDAFTLGLGLSGVAVALFAAEMLNHQLYYLIHSCWHVDAALGQYMLLCIWKRKAVLLYSEKKPNHKGHKVSLMDMHPHPYAIPAATTTQRLSHLTPPSRVIVKE